MKRKNVNQILSLLLLLLIIAVVAIVYLSVRQAERERVNSSSAAHAEKVINLATQVELFSNDFVIATRDFLNSHDTAFAMLMRVNRERIIANLAVLKKMEQDNTAQQKYIDSMHIAVTRLMNTAAPVEAITYQQIALIEKEELLDKVRPLLRNSLEAIRKNSLELIAIEAKKKQNREETGERVLYTNRLLTYIVLGLILILSLFIISRIRTVFARQAASEQKFITLLEAAPDATIIANEQGRIVMANRQAEKLLGYTQQELLQMEVEQLVPATIRDKHAAIRDEFVNQGRHRGMHSGQELIAARKDGSQVSVEISLSPITTNEGRFIAAALRDITLRKNAEAQEIELRHEVHYLASLTQQMSEAVISRKADCRKLFSWNAGAEKLFGFTKEEAIGKTVTELGILKLTKDDSLVIETALSSMGKWKGENKFYRKDGTSFEGTISANVVSDIPGEQFYVFLIKDISVEKQLEEVLKKNNEELEEKVESRTREINLREQQYRYLFENNPLPMWVFDVEDFRFLDVNEMAIQKYGYSREEFLSMTLTDIRPEADRERFRHFDHAWKMSSQDTNRGVWRHCKKNGDIIDVEVIAHSILFQEKKARLVLLNDVTTRLKTEKELQGSEKKFRALIENSNDMIVLMEGDNRISYRSPSAAKITGWSNEEMAKKSFLDDIVHPDDQPRIREVLRTIMLRPGVPEVIYYRSLHKNGHYINLEGILINLLHRDYVRALVFNLRDVTEQKKAERLLVDREKRFRALIEHSADIINLMDEKFQLIYRSPSAQRIGGYSDEEVFGRDIRERVHPDDLEAVQEKMYFLSCHPGASIDILIRYKVKKGNYVWLEGTAVNLLNEPSVNAYVFNYRDVSPRIEAEEMLANREKHFRALIENSMDVIAVLDETLTMVYRSPSAIKVTGLTDEVTIGRDVRYFIHPEDLGSVNVLLQELLRLPGKSMNLLFRYRCAEGNYIWVEGSATNLLKEDNIRGLVFNLRDVTERIMKEEKIVASEERYRKTLDNMIEGVQIIGYDMKYKYVNAALAAQAHTTPDQLIGYTMMDCFPGIEQTAVYKSIEQCLVDRQPVQLENHFVLPDGEQIWVELSIQPVPEGIFILSMDITEKMKAARALKEEQDKLAAIADSSPGLIYSFQLRPDGSMRFPYASNAMEEMFGYGLDFVNKDISRLLNSTIEDDRELFVESMRKSAENLEPWNLEFRFHNPKKGVIWVEGNSIPYRDADGTVTWHGVLMDVTERKRIQEKITEQSAQLKTLSDNLPGVMIFQLAGDSFDNRRFTYVSSEVTRLTGKKPEEVIADPTLLYNCILPEDLPLILLAEKISYENQAVFNEEVRFRDFQGNIRWLNIISTPRKTDSGDMVWDGFHLDITDRKNAENAIRESEERYRTLVEQAFDGILFYDINGRILECNNSGANTIGYTREELLDMNVTDLFFEQDIQIRPLEISNVTEGNQVFDYRTMRRKDGTAVEIELVTRLLPDGRYLAVGRDITDQNKALSQQNLLSSIVNSTDDAILSTDVNGVITSWNKGAEQIFGYSAEEMIGKDHRNLWLEKKDEHETEIMDRIYNGELLQHYETKRKRKDGTHILVSITTSTLINKKGELTGISKVVRDITKQKEDEERIRLSNERYEAVAKATSDAIWDFDYQTNRTFIAGTGYRDLFGYELVNTFSEPQFWEQRIHPDDYNKVMENMERVKSNPAVTQSNLEYRFRKADGSWAYLNDRFFIIRDKDGKPLRLLGAKQDITRQKEAEKELIQSAEEKQLLYERLAVILNTLPASVALLDPKGVMVEVNDAWKNFADVNGFSGEQYGVGTSYLTISTQSFGNNEQIGKDISAGIQAVLNGNSSQFEYEYPWHLPKLNRWFRIVVTPLKGREFTGAVVMHMDISEIRRLEQERIESRIEEQKKITEAMLKGQEKERNAIGIELHDNVNQILVGTKVLLSVVRDFPEKTHELIPSCIDNISLAVQENRKIAHELVTPNLSDESMLQQITRLTQTMLKNAGINTYINHESLNEALLPDELKLALYRVAQEQCTNIIKYAKAEQVIISLATKRDNFFMRIADDGHGTDPKKVTHGIGLKNISSRLSVFGGTISIDTAPEQGFALEIEIPLQPVKTEKK